jgi:hypothetical protein
VVSATAALHAKVQSSPMIEATPEPRAVTSDPKHSESDAEATRRSF